MHRLDEETPGQVDVGQHQVRRVHALDRDDAHLFRGEARFRDLPLRRGERSWPADDAHRERRHRVGQVDVGVPQAQRRGGPPPGPQTAHLLGRHLQRHRALEHGVREVHRPGADKRADHSGTPEGRPPEVHVGLRSGVEEGQVTADRGVPERDVLCEVRPVEGHVAFDAGLVEAGRTLLEVRPLEGGLPGDAHAREIGTSFEVDAFEVCLRARQAPEARATPDPLHTEAQRPLEPGLVEPRVPGHPGVVEPHVSRDTCPGQLEVAPRAHLTEMQHRVEHRRRERAAVVELDVPDFRLAREPHLVEVRLPHPGPSRRRVPEGCEELVEKVLREAGPPVIEVGSGPQRGEVSGEVGAVQMCETGRVRVHPAPRAALTACRVPAARPRLGVGSGHARPRLIPPRP